MLKIVVTGAGGLIGSAAAIKFASRGCDVYGIDNNMRQEFFGPGGDVTPMIKLLNQYKTYTHAFIDIRNRKNVIDLISFVKPDVVIHCAAQPSHDKAASIPFDDFDVNAAGTMNLLEATRLHSPKASFIFTSTNKVYGDSPNNIPMIELETRYDYIDDSSDLFPGYYEGVRETQSIDQCTHSLFGASKVAADIMCQEYGKYFGMNVGVFRGGCLTGPNHSGVQLHGFLSYLVKCAVKKIPYTIFGYKGKQVRDQIHSTDVVRAFEAFISNPRSGEVYNLGGGRKNSASVLETISMIEKIAGNKIDVLYSDNVRKGDHKCYITNLSKFKNHFPSWDVTISLDEIIREMIRTEVENEKC